MTKFASIWGDLEVGHVTQKDETAKVEPKKEIPTDDDTIQTKDSKVDTEDDDVIVKKTETKIETKVEAKTEDEPEDLVFEDEEIEKTYNLLIDEGVLPEPEDEDDFDISPAGLADAIAAVTRKNLAAEIAAIPESVQQFYGHVMDGKDPSSFKLQTAIVWDDINLENEANQELALTQFYVNQGMSAEEAQEEIEDVKVAGKLERKADVARESLVKIQEANATARKEKEDVSTAKQQKEADDEINALKKTIDDSKSIAGFELDDKKRAAFKKYLFDQKPRTGKTQMQENMSSEDRRMNIAFLDFVDFTKADIKKEVETEITKKRKKKLARYSDKGVRGSNSSKSVTTKIDSNKGKVVFPSMFNVQSDAED
jgi:hypothetical protein